SGKEGRTYASELAKRLFVADALEIDRDVRILEHVEPLLSGSTVKFAGRTSAHETCKKPPTVAYVPAAGPWPIFLCAFASHAPAELYLPVMDEAFHWAGIVVDPWLPEVYCETFDCQTSCGTGDIADAWMHYISCLGEPPKLKRSFIPELIESVNEID